MRQRVVIVGGGVAGLSAAHELIERNFEVHLVERRTHLGGKAASVRVDDPGSSGSNGRRTRRNQLPTEHGFRFYPGWYRHLPDTMGRIPYKGSRPYYQGATVLDNLVAADEELLAWYDREPIRMLAHPPRNLGEARTALSLAGELARLGLRPGEIAFFIGKIVEFLATPESRRAERYDRMTWWQYLDADNRSQAFQDLVSATTRSMVAAKARQASAYTIGNMAVRTLFDLFGTVDRVLNGPTNEAWIDPWTEYLQGRGVQFHLGYELESVEFDADRKAIGRLRFTSLVQQAARRLRRVLGRVECWARVVHAQPIRVGSRPVKSAATSSLRARAAELKRTAEEIDLEAQLADRVVNDLLQGDQRQEAREGMGQAIERLKETAEALARAAEEASLAVENLPDDRQANRGEVLDRVLHPYREQIQRSATALVGLLPGKPGRPSLRDSLVPALEDLLGQDDPLRQELERQDPQNAPSTSYIFALPLEQMAYYVNRSPMMTQYDPRLRRIVLLAEHTDWMTGLQFFLKEPMDMVPGHLVCMDSEWSLTAIEETQYWRDVELPADIKAVLSVDIAAWDRKGRFNQKEAYNCTPLEIAQEAWSQLKRSLNREGKMLRLREEMLRYGALQAGDGKRSYHLDESLVELLDRKKQGSYEKARSVRFSADELMRRQQETGHESETPYAWGRRLNFNTEPILINRVGTQALRPEARTAIPNMFLAADYVSTGTDLACMESANEAARRAVNGLLDAVGSSESRCQIWGFSAPRDLVDRLSVAVRAGDRLAGVFGMANRAVGTVAGELTRFAGDLASRRRGQDG
jgi:uncharacterized protein with NAD-binding domain and iron-sulfur cluster